MPNYFVCLGTIIYSLPFDYLAYTGTIDSNHLNREINVTQTLKDFKNIPNF